MSPASTLLLAHAACASAALIVLLLVRSWLGPVPAQALALLLVAALLLGSL